MANLLMLLGIGPHIGVAGAASYYVLEVDGTSKYQLEDALDTLTFDATATGNAATSSLSWSHTTTTNSNRILIVGVSWRGTGSITGVTYNSVAMTSIGSASGANNTKMEMFRLVAPSTGANTVSVTFTGSIDGSIGGSFSFYNAHQSSFGAFNSATGIGGTATVNITSQSTEIVVDTLSWDRGTAVAAGAGQTERWDADDAAEGDVRGAGSTETGASSVTMSWTGGGAEAWAIGGVSVKPSTVATTDALILE